MLYLTFLKGHRSLKSQPFRGTYLKVTGLFTQPILKLSDCKYVSMNIWINGANTVLEPDSSQKQQHIRKFLQVSKIV